MKKGKLSYAKYGYYFIIPFVIAYLIFSLYPTVYTLIIGFTDLKGVDTKTFNFMDDPLYNFKLILNNRSFKTSLSNTFRMWIFNFIPQIVLALILTAWFTDNRFKIKGQGIFKVLFYMPNIITAASVALLFSQLFGYPLGPVNDLFQSIGILDKPYEFARNKAVSQGIVSFIQFWMWYGYSMIIFISGVLGISPDIFEAAQIDGANRLQTFFKITIPNIKTILVFSVITSVIGGLNMFDIPRCFLDGGPDNATLTSSLFIYNQAFSGSYFYNRAAAASMIMFGIIAVLSVIVFFLMRDKDEALLKKQMKAQRKAYKKYGTTFTASSLEKGGSK